MFDKIQAWLSAQSIQYKHIHHLPTKTSEAAALARGVDLSIGGKALVLKIDDSFKLCVISAAKN